MGSQGIEIREKSIRLAFSIEGKRYKKTVMVNGKAAAPTPANVKYAHRLRAEIVEKITLSTFSMAEYFPASGDGGSVTLGDQLDTFLSAHRIAGSTKSGYQSAIKFWKSAPCGKLALGEMPLRAVKHSHILLGIASRPNLKGKTINNYVSVLREALELAVTDGLLSTNPTQQVKRAKHQKEPPDPFSRDEAEAITRALHSKHPGQVANFVEAWFWTGMRTSEIFALKWSDIDLKGGTMLVRRAVVQGVEKDTKTSTSRVVILNSRALAAIKAQKAHTYIAGAHVFNDPRYGTPWKDERAFRRSFWTPTLKRLGIRYRRPYNCRHTYATTMLMAGMTPAFCARQLGHSIEMFLRTYAKWLDGQQNDAEMARLESAILCPFSGTFAGKTGE